VSEANPYDRPFEAESLGRFWALQAVRRAIAPFSIRRPHSEFPFFGEALTPEQREQVAERVAALAEAAAPGTGLAELAGGAVNDGFRDEDMRALGELCDELQQPIVDELKAAGPSRQKTIASLVSMFQNGDIADSDDDLLDAALIIGEATAPEWRVAVQEHWAQRSEAARNDIGPMFWRRTEGSYENVLRYRVGTELGIEGLDEVWRLVEREVRQTLAEGPHPLAFDLAHVALSAELAQGQRMASDSPSRRWSRHRQTTAAGEAAVPTTFQRLRRPRTPWSLSGGSAMKKLTEWLRARALAGSCPSRRNRALGWVGHPMAQSRARS
jgi:hypothetical protein